MSRLSERLGRVRKSSGSIGFGVGANRVEARRMLVLPVLDAALSGDAGETLRRCVDAIIVQHRPEEGRSALTATQESFKEVPVGLRLAGPDFDEKALVGECDFILCTIDAPFSVLTLKSTGLFLELDAGVEAGRLRALADLGVEGVVLTAESLDLRSLATAVECRRVRTMAGCPLMLKVLAPPSPTEVSGLWRSGVDGLVTDTGGGIDLLLAVRDAIDQAKLDTSTTQADLAVSIGSQLRGMSGMDEEEVVEDDDYDGA